MVKLFAVDSKMNGQTHISDFNLRGVTAPSMVEWLYREAHVGEYWEEADHQMTEDYLSESHMTTAILS